MPDTADSLPHLRPKHNTLQQPLSLPSPHPPHHDPTLPSPDPSDSSAATVTSASLPDPTRRPRRNLSLRDRPGAATAGTRRRDSLPSHRSSTVRAPERERLTGSFHSGTAHAQGIASASPAASPRYPLIRDRALLARRLSTSSTSTYNSDHPTTPANTAALQRPSSSGSTTTATSVTRTHSQRRPPAYRSSHGIETTYGPPPSLITRGSSTSDVVRRIQQQYRDALTHQQQGYFGFEQTREGKVRRNSISTTTLESNRLSLSALSRATRDSRSRMRSDMSQDEKDSADAAGMNAQRSSTAATGSPMRRGETPEGQTTTTDGDLFLKLADSPLPKGGASERVDRRRSRIARAAQRQSLPENVIPNPQDQTPSLGRSKVSDLSESSQIDSPLLLRNNRMSAHINSSTSTIRRNSAVLDSSPAPVSHEGTPRASGLPRR